MDKLGRGWIPVQAGISFGAAYVNWSEGSLWLLVLLAAGVFAVRCKLPDHQSSRGKR